MKKRMNRIVLVSMMLAICFLISAPFTTVSYGVDVVIHGAPNVTNQPLQAEKLNGYPSNWGKWGPNDEIGTLNYLTPEVVAKAAKAVKSGKVFTLQRLWKGGNNDPLWPGRVGMVRMNVSDYGTYLDGKYPSKTALSDMWAGDDWIGTFTHGTSHIDALGHVSYGNVIYNGYPAQTTMTKMTKASVASLAEKGIVTRGVLLDVAKFKGKGPGESLDRNYRITFKDLQDTAKAQGVTIKPNDWLLIRTGFLNGFDKDPKTFYNNFLEPGISAEKELVEWWAKMPIIGWSTDTIACEQTVSDVTGTVLPLHAAFLRNLGSTMNELVTLEKLAEDCANDGQYTGLFIASPLKIDGATGGPVNPVFIK